MHRGTSTTTDTTRTTTTAASIALFDDVQPKKEGKLKQPLMNTAKLKQPKMFNRNTAKDRQAQDANSKSAVSYSQAVIAGIQLQ